MPLKLISAGGGSLTLSANSTASNYTLTVPAITGELVTTDSNGNVGLGISPSAWSIGKALQIGSSGDSSILGYNNASYLLSNAYYNGGWKYTAAGKAAFQYFQNGATGYAQWSSAPVGTNAGDAITFTTLMTLNNAGNLGIGTTNPLSLLNISGVSPIDNSGASGKWTARLRDTTSMTAGVGAGILFQGSKTTDGAAGNFAAIAGLKENSTESNESGYLAFYTTPNSTQLITERMRIDSSGNVGIGTASPSQKLHLASAASAGNIYALIDSSLTANGYNAATLYKNDQRMFRVGVLGTVGGFTNGALVVYDETAAQWRMVITSGGDVYFGQTSVTTPPTTGVDILAGGLIINPSRRTTAATTPVCVWDSTTGNFNRSTSSLKYKRDVQDATYGLKDVLNLRPVTFKGKSESDGDRVFGGLIAEEVHDAGLTMFVDYAEDGTPDGLGYAAMVSLAFKAIQELTDKLDEAIERIKILESK